MFGGDGGSLHVASGSVEQGVDASVFPDDIVAVLLNHLLIHHVGLEELTFAAILLYVGNDLSSHVFLTAEDYHFGAIECQVLCDGAAQYSGAARDGYHVAIDIK